MSHDLAGELRTRARERNSTRPKGPELPHVEELTSPSGLPLRLYRPGDGPRPLLVFLHGGGWVFCDLETHDLTCRRIAKECDVNVMAVDYRLAPEHPYPAAIDDAVEIIRWARPAAVAGDSAGAYLATMACLRLRDEGCRQPSVQILLYPNTDLTQPPSSPACTTTLPSPPANMSTLASAAVETSTDTGLDADELAWFISQWAPDPARRRAASPLHQPDLTGLPTTLLITAEHDPLRAEGDAYARRLAESGTRIHHRCEPDLPHGFLQTHTTETTPAHERLFTDIRTLIPR